MNLVLDGVQGASGAGVPLTYTIASFPTGIFGPGATDLTPYFNVTGEFLTPPTVALVANGSVRVTFTPVPEPGWILAIGLVGGGARAPRGGRFRGCRS